MRCLGGYSVPTPIKQESNPIYLPRREFHPRHPYRDEPKALPITILAQ
jgi:hypothetical protein